MEETFNSSNNTKNEFLMKEKKHLITFAKINKYFLIPFLSPVFCMLSNFFLLLITQANVITKKEFFGPCFIVLSYIGAGLLYFISYFRRKVDNGKESIIYRERAPSNITLIYNEGKQKSLIKEIILIICIGFLCTLFELLSFFAQGYKLFEERLYFLFFIPLFSKLILKDDIFKHQYFSLLIAIFGIILLLIPTGLELIKEDFIPNIFNFISAISFSLFIVLIKYVTHVYYISPFKLSFIYGLISLGFILIGFFFYSIIKYHDLSYFKDCLYFSFNNNQLEVSIYFIVTLILAIILQSLELLVIYYFSPILLMVTDIISPMCLWVALAIMKTPKIYEIILNPIGYLIVLFASLIYNEIIIFNFWNLNKDTKKLIEERLIEESKDIRKTENELKLGTLDTSDADLGTNDNDRNSNSS